MPRLLKLELDADDPARVVGTSVGAAVGRAVGFSLGTVVGTAVGLSVGVAVGSLDGELEALLPELEDDALTLELELDPLPAVSVPAERAAITATSSGTPALIAA